MPILTTGDFRYSANLPGQFGEFNAGSARYDTSRLASNFAYFTPEIIRRVTRLDVPPTQSEFETLVAQIQAEYNREKRSAWLRRQASHSN